MFRAPALAIVLSFCLLFGAPSPTLAQNVSGAEFKLQITEPAYAGLPVWIQADLPRNLTAHYPYHEDPGLFGPNKIELKRDGKVLPAAIFLTVPSFGGILDGWIAPPGSPTNRLPLHLTYSLDTPGTYSVRWTVVRHEFSPTTRQFSEIMLAQSKWLTFELKASTPKQREAWLRQELQSIPSDPGLVAGDFLPSLISQAPDPRVLRAVIDQLYSTTEAVNAYALGCVYRFPDRDIHSQTLETIRHRGANERLAYFISWRGDLFKDDSGEIVRAVLPFLRSRDDAQVVGALRTLGFTAHFGDSLLHPDLRKIADDAVIAVSPDLLTRGQKVTWPLASFLGEAKTPASRELPLQMVREPGPDNGQAFIALTWIANPDDLPQLGELLVKPGSNDATGRDRANLVYNLMRGYGNRAIPFLEKAVTDSPYAFVRLQSAEQLVTRGSPIAFRFFLDTVNQNTFYKAEAIRSLKDQFPKDLSPASDDAAIVAFLKARLAQSPDN
jgi:hypothetical protein